MDSAKQAQALNSKIEYATKAKSFYNPIDPKQGMLLIGDRGIEFQQVDAPGFIQIPYEEILKVRADVIFKKHIRGFFIDTKDYSFNFLVQNAKPTLIEMRKHLDPKIMVVNRNFISKFFRKFKKKNTK